MYKYALTEHFKNLCRLDDESELRHFLYPISIDYKGHENPEQSRLHNMPKELIQEVFNEKNPSVCKILSRYVQSPEFGITPELIKEVLRIVDEQLIRHKNISIKK